jgi:hypothetical protein
MKKLFTILTVGLLFILVSCDSGTKKDTDKDLGTTDNDIMIDVEVTDDLSDEVVTGSDDDSPVPDESEVPDEYDDTEVLADEDPDEDPDDSFTPEEYTVDGFVQKGPFIKDSSIKITELDNNFEMIPATTFTTQTIDDLGNFSIKRIFRSRYILLEASGFYYNEVAGGVSSTQITNYVFVDLKANNSKININILTTLARKRIQYLMKNGKNFNEARSQAEIEVLEIFGIFGEQAANFQDMDILKAGNSNAMLLAISARLQGNNTPGDLSSLVADIIYEIEENGELKNSALKTKINEGSKYIASKLSDIRVHLEYHFGAKTTVDLPNFEDYCDNSGNGIINKWDLELDFPTIEKAEIDTVYISEERTVKVNPVTTAIAKTDIGTIIINGADTGSRESLINDGDKIALKVVSSKDMETAVTAMVFVEFTVNEGNFENWTVSGSFSVKTVECDNNDIRTFECGEDNNGSKTQMCEQREWRWVDNGDCTRIYNCSSKPENSKWNLVEKYTQTWNGAEWIPSDSTPEHSFIPSPESCFFECSEGYGWNGDECILSNCQGNFPYYHKGYCWSNTASSLFNLSGALSYCDGLGGRLPNIKELRMLLHNCQQIEYPQPDGLTDWCQVTDTCVESSCRNDACSGCPVDYSGKYNVFGETGAFSSSTTYVDGTNHIWIVEFTYASVGYGNKSGGHRVVCVKSE